MEIFPAAISLALYLLFCFIRTGFFVAGEAPASDFNRVRDIAINCGSKGSFTSLDGREWIGDTDSEMATLKPPKGESVSSTAFEKIVSGPAVLDPVPYMTARISFSELYFSFQVSPGQKFIRLHFNPAPHRGFHKLKDIFTVKAGSYILLDDFSPSHAADALGSKFFIKEFAINVEENQSLNISFIPSKIGKSFTYINGIEIVSMPTGLYYTSDGLLGIPVVGQKYKFHIDNGTALELVQRLNIGGRFIPAVEDPGLFRTWSEDTDLLLENGLLPVYYATRVVRYQDPTFAAPPKVHQTFWSTSPNHLKKDLPRFSWKIALNTGFEYLLRLHFCELESSIVKTGQRRFSILINGHIVEPMADVIQWSGGNGIPVYKDYILILKGEKEASRVNVTVAMESKYNMTDGLLNGLEVLKLSNHDKCLASRNHAHSTQRSLSCFPNLRKLATLLGSGNQFLDALILVLILVNVGVSSIRKTWGTNTGYAEGRPSTSTPQCRLFSLAEIHSATENFSDSLVIGRGGFGKVYKGYMNKGADIVAIKRLSSNSKQGANEFWIEIETLSKLRHNHLVSLLGYCNESKEMILVYDYVSGGPLSHHLSGAGGNYDCHKTWEQWLRICIGAARGLDYLHTGSKLGVIHRDVKSSNILLDENFVAKLSDFGLAKLEKPSPVLTHISTNVKGTHGYIDPQYFYTRKLTRKSDVYSFGVVLLEVLCGRRAIDMRLPEDQWSLASWAQMCIRDESINRIIAESLKEKISQDSLKLFVNIVGKCLHEQPKKRPTMAQVVVDLEFALELQEMATLPPNNEVLSDDMLYSENRTNILEDNNLVPQVSQANEIYPSVMANKGHLVRKVSFQNDRKDWQTPKKDSTYENKLLRNWPWGSLWRRGKASKNLGTMDNSNLHAQKLSKSSSPDRTWRSFSIAEIESATDHFNCYHIIKQDKYSTDYKGFLQSKGVLIKVLKTKVQAKELADLHTEIWMLSQLHPNLMPLIGFSYRDSKLIIVHDYTTYRNLCDFIHDNEDYPLPWKSRLKICIGVAQGLYFLHETAGLIHQDMKPANVLFDEEWVVKLTNYELSKVIPFISHGFPTDSLEMLPCDYLPPKHFICDSPVTKECNVFSFGLILLEVLSGRKTVKRGIPYGERYLPYCVKRSILDGTLDRIIDPHLEEKIPAESLKEFLKISLSCLLHQANKRPSMGVVAEALEFAYRLQETAAVNSFSLEGVCDEVSVLADQIVSSENDIEAIDVNRSAQDLTSLTHTPESNDNSHVQMNLIDDKLKLASFKSLKA